MIVARQFIAWYPCKKGNRPGGHGMIESDRRATTGTSNQPWVRIRPSPTGRGFGISPRAATAQSFSLRTPSKHKMRRQNSRRIHQPKIVLGIKALTNCPIYANRCANRRCPTCANHCPSFASRCANCPIRSIVCRFDRTWTWFARRSLCVRGRLAQK